MLCAALVIGGGLFGCSTVNKLPPRYVVTYGSSERPDMLSYSTPSPRSLQQIKISRISLRKEELSKLADLPKSKTDYGLRWLVEEKPNTMRDGPWNTRLYLFEAGHTKHCLRVELIDHASYEVKYSWLNEKMLFVSVSWGRIAWTDFVLNSETLRFSYIEEGRLDAVLDGQGE